MVSRKLRVFLRHASQDKPIVRELYQRLPAAPYGDGKEWINSWLDEDSCIISAENKGETDA